MFGFLSCSEVTRITGGGSASAWSGKTKSALDEPLLETAREHWPEPHYQPRCAKCTLATSVALQTAGIVFNAVLIGLAGFSAARS